MDIPLTRTGLLQEQLGLLAVLANPKVIQDVPRDSRRIVPLVVLLIFADSFQSLTHTFYLGLITLQYPFFPFLLILDLPLVTPYLLYI